MNLTLKSIEVENFVVFDKAKLKLPKGITLIHGVNHDRFNEGTSVSDTNATGKSAFFSALSECLIDSPVISLGRADYSAFKKQGFAAICLKGEDGHLYTVKKSKDAKGIKREIYKDDVLLTSHKKTSYEEVLKDIFPHSDLVYSSLIHLDGRLANSIQRGSADVRFQIFEEIFNLSFFNTLHNEAKKKAALLKDALTLHKANEARLAEVKEKMGTLSVEALLARRKKLKDRRAKLAKKLNALHLKAGVAGGEQAAEAKKVKEALFTYGEALSVAFEAGRFSDVECNLTIAAKALKEKERYDEAKQLVKNFNSLWDRQSHLLEMLKPFNLEDASFVEIQNKLERNLTKLSDEVDELKLEVKQAVHLEALHKEGKCPTCQQSTKHLPSPGKKVKELKEGLIKKEGYLSHLQMAVDLAVDLTGDLKIWAPSLLKEKITTIAFEASAATISEEAKEIKAFIKSLTSKASLLNLAKLKGKEVKGISALSKSVRAFADAYSKKQREEADEDLSQTISTIEAKIEQCEVREMEVNEALGTARHLRQEADALTLALKESEDAAAKEEVLSLVKEVLGPKGARIHALQTFVKIFEDRLNSFAPLIFAEDFVFKCHVEGRNFYISYSTKGRDFMDVKKLSGSEGACFSLLCLKALQPLLQSKPNFCILDEMDAHLSTASKELFYTLYLPKLNDIIPIIVVITTKSAEEIAADFSASFNVVAVERRGGVSTLVGS